MTEVLVLAELAESSGAAGEFIATTFKALAQGAVYALVALGFVLIYKASQAVNFAQGAMALVALWWFSMILFDWELPALFGLEQGSMPYYVTGLLVACVLAAVLGLIVERLVVRKMIGEPLFSIAIITLGLEAVFRAIAQDAVGVEPRSVATPWGSDGVTIAGAFVPTTYLGAILVAAVCFVAIFVFFRTKLGVAMRAVAFDQEAALAQGIDVGRVFAIAWAISGAITLLAAAFAAMTPFAVGTATVGTTALAFRALPAVILGGLDSVGGALIGGLAVGLVEALFNTYQGEGAGQFLGFLGSNFAGVSPYVLMLIVLMVKPYGLFGTPEIERV